MSNAENRGRQASIEGFANEHIVVGILMKKYQNVSLVDLPLSPYDIVIVRKMEDGTEEIIRAQVKTARKSVSFTGGTRGGVDRAYKSGIKEYIQNPVTSDVVIGCHPNENGSYDLYFIPTLLIERWGAKSRSLKRILPLKNNYEFLEQSKDHDFILKKSEEYGLL